MNETLLPADHYRHPAQVHAPLIYDIHSSWEDNVARGPVFWSGEFPPSHNQKNYRFLGRNIISPVTVAAGPASGKLWTDFYFKMGYGMVMEKTRRTVPRKSNQAPNIAIVGKEEQITRDGLGEQLLGHLDVHSWARYQSMTNSFGNPSSLVEEWARELVSQKQAAGDGQLFGCSVTATAIDGGGSSSVILGETSPAIALVETANDLVIASTAAIVAGADVIELNMACPNVTDHPEEGEMFQDSRLVRYTFSELRRRFPDFPIGFKAGLYKAKDQMRKVLTEGGDNISFISSINAIAMPVVGIDGNPILPGRLMAGTCGRPLQTIALEQIDWAADIKAREGLKLEIIGGGGITKAEDVDQYLDAGADVVFSGSAVLANPLLAYEYRLLKEGSK